MEIAHYDVIEAAAEALGDRDTVKLAKTHRRQEEAMQRLLGRQIAALVKAVIRDEVPAAERALKRASRSSASARPRKAAPERKSTRKKAGTTKAKRAA